MFTGQQIKLYLGSDNGLQDNKSYKVCHNISSLMKSNNDEQRTRRAKVVSPSITTTPPKNRRSPRLSKNDRIVSPVALPSPRKRVHMRHTRAQPKPFIKLKNLKGVTIVVGLNYSTRRPLKKRTGHRTKWVNSLLEESVKYKFLYRKLVIRECVQRVDDVSKLVLAACIDNAQLKSVCKSYLHGNEELAIDTVSFLDCIRNRRGIELNINLRNNKTDEFTPLCDEEEEERICNQE